jgi:hypothetical protein
MKAIRFCVAGLVIGAIGVAVLVGCTASSTGALAGLTVSRMAGNWAGAWNNTTFGTTGPTTLNITDNPGAQTATFVLDMDGNVFGGGDPAPFTFTANYNATTLTVSQAGTFFGDLSFTATSGGVLTGSATNLTNYPNIARVDITGTATATTVTLNYNITFTGGGTATGVLTLTKQ